MTRTIGLLAICLVFMSIYLVFSYAEIEATMLEVQKIFYFHVSSALVAFMAFAVTCAFSFLYLIKRKNKFDRIAVSSAELGIIFCLIVLVTGPIWARSAWGTWWNWEPRLTSTLIMLLTYTGYLILRSSTEGDRKKIYSAILGIIAYVNVPIVYFSVEMWQGSLHPPTSTKMNMATTMTITWIISWIAIFFVYLFLLMLRVRSEKMRLQFANLQSIIHKNINN